MHKCWETVISITADPGPNVPPPQRWEVVRLYLTSTAACCGDSSFQRTHLYMLDIVKDLASSFSWDKKKFNFKSAYSSFWRNKQYETEIFNG